MSSVKIEEAFARVEIRPMHELDIPVIAAIEKAAYQFPWSEGIFRDCLRVGYVCRMVDVVGDMGGYGIMSVGAGEAHILNVCIRDEYRSRGFARKMTAVPAGAARVPPACSEAFLEVRPSNVAAARLYHSWASNRSACDAATTKPRSAAKMPRCCAAMLNVAQEINADLAGRESCLAESFIYLSNSISYKCLLI